MGEQLKTQIQSFLRKAKPKRTLISDRWKQSNVPRQQSKLHNFLLHLKIKKTFSLFERLFTTNKKVWEMSGFKITVVLGQTVHSRGCPGVKQNIISIDIIAII